MTILFWIIGVLVALWVGCILFMMAIYDRKNDHSGDGGLAVLAIVILPFIPLLFAYQWVHTKLTGRP